MSARRMLIAAVACAGGVLAVGAPAFAQEPTPGEREWVQLRTETPRARLGLFLGGTCAAAEAREVCDEPPIVISVSEDGPADRAGIRARDTLIALDGARLVTPEGRLALQALVPGTQVTLSVARSDGRREIVVTPEIREPTHVMHFEWRTPEVSGEPSPMRVYRFPTPMALAELDVHLDSIVVGEGDPRAYVLFGPDAEGNLTLEVMGAEASPDGGRERRIVIDSSAAWVVASPQLASRLKHVRARTLEVARVRLDSLLRLQDEGVRVMAAPLPGTEAGRIALGVVRERPDDSLFVRRSTGVDPLFVASRGVAGAEFRDLTPELAEYFEGVDRGLLVMRVIPGTPAGELGLRGGDVVVECGGSPVHSTEAFRAAVAGSGSGSLTVKWIRKGVEVQGVLSSP